MIGLVKLANLAISLANTLKRHCLRSKKPLLSRYGGKGTWALVTGASDGIGAETCIHLARDGFNIVLVSRSKGKMKDVVEEIKRNAPSVETRIVVADFCTEKNIAFYENIMKKVADLDIGLAVINAGIALGSLLEDQPLKDVEMMLDCNVYHPGMLLKLIVKMLDSRKKQSGIILTSSVISGLPAPILDIYAATKVFDYYLSLAVAFELKQSGKRIDLMAVKPGQVITKMTEKMDKAPTAVSRFVSVNGTLRDLGYEVETNGPFRHEMDEFMITTGNQYAQETTMHALY